ncbi:hypothetical protein OF83DRAFT_637649 [Amylostereum chailletii]|nr:hypothetical protein OF83DRAFT_637649 [Amylostereum chailletii]
MTCLMLDAQLPTPVARPHIEDLHTRVRARPQRIKATHLALMEPHTYLDGTVPFTYLGLWATGSFHSTATLSIQRELAVCTCFGVCTVAIFPCPASALGLGGPFFFMSVYLANPNPIAQYKYSIWKYTFHTRGSDNGADSVATDRQSTPQSVRLPGGGSL